MICVPPDDPESVAAVEDAFAKLGGGALSDEELVAGVKAMLKARTRVSGSDHAIRSRSTCRTTR